jgi:hypothetical protein
VQPGVAGARVRFFAFGWRFGSRCHSGLSDFLGSSFRSVGRYSRTVNIPGNSQ